MELIKLHNYYLISHLHNYNKELMGRETGQLQKITKPFILIVNCAQWGFDAGDCN